MTETKTVKALRSCLEIPTRPDGTIQAWHHTSSSRIEVSNDQSIRGSQSPRRLSDSGGGFSQPEDNAWSATTLTLRSITSTQENPSIQAATPPCRSAAKDFSHAVIPKTRARNDHHSHRMCRTAHREPAGEVLETQKPRKA